MLRRINRKTLPKWTKPLSAAEIKHLANEAGGLRLETARSNYLHHLIEAKHRAEGLAHGVCNECLSIGRKLFRGAIRKAQPFEKELHAKLEHTLYPLYGFVTVEHRGGTAELKIEYLGDVWGKDDPQYEVLALDGMHFAGGMMSHTLVCFDLEDVRDRAVSYGDDMQECTLTSDCGCGGE
jgi:hypothetical protein